MSRVGGLVNIRQDVAYAFRLIRRSPGFAAVTMLTLALGIGANTSLFTVTDALLLRPLPMWRPERLVQIAGIYRTGSRIPLSYGLYQELERNQRIFSGIFAWTGGQESELEYGGSRSLCNVRGVSGNFYPALETTPYLGRLISAADADNKLPVAVLGYEFWQRQFGGDPAIVGRTIHIRRDAYTVIGISRRWFTGMTPGSAPDISVPITSPRFATLASTHASLFLFTAGRLKDGATLEQAETQLRSFWPQALLATLPTNIPGPRRDAYLAMRLHLIPAATGINVDLRTRFGRPLQVLMGLAALILLVACVNLASLSLARAIARNRELAIRISLGASRGSLVRQMLAESLLMSSAGALLAIPLAAFAAQFLVTLVNGRSAAPVVLNLRPDWRVFAFAAAAAIATGVLIAMAPVWQATRRQPASVLRSDDRTSASSSGWLGKTLIVAQIALSLMLLLGATLLLRTLENLRTFDPQYQRHGVLEVGLYPQPDAPKVDLAAYRKELLANLAALPSVESVGFSNYSIPIGADGWTDNVTLVRNRAAGADTNRAVTLIVVSPDFFRSLGIPITGGRGFQDSDDKNHPAVAIVDGNLAKKLSAFADPVGTRVRFGVQPEFQELEVVGVARAARIIDVRDAQSMVIYVPAAQHPDFSEMATLYVRAQEPLGLERPIEQQISSLGQEFSSGARTLEVANEQALVEERATALLAGSFGAIALLLAGLGLFGLMSYTVTRRTREIAIRMALGSDRAGILRLVLSDSQLLTCIGVALGVPCALVGTRLVRHMLFGVGPFDLGTITLCAVLLLLVGVVAGYLPAHRATGIAPAMALKAE